MDDARVTAPHGVEGQATVLVASEDVLARWSTSASPPTDLLVVADVDDQHALAVIERRRPQIVVLEEAFAASARGAHLVGRLRANAHLAGLDIRVLPAAGSSVLGGTAPITGRALASVARPLPAGTRRAARIRMPQATGIRIDGASVALIDVSPLGAQVVSLKALKPNQKVEVVIDRDGVNVRARAEVVWSSAVKLVRTGIAYRAGLAFVQAQPAVLKLGSTGGGTA